MNEPQEDPARPEREPFRRTPFALLLVAALALAILGGCARSSSPEPTITIDGSSTVFPITDTAARHFQKRNPVRVDVEVPIGISGTGGGFRKFCAGTTDISDASRPINKEEAALCASNGVEYIEIPIAYDGLAVVVNPKNSWAKDITTSELKRLWEPAAERRIVRWSQLRAGWPEKALHLYGAGLDSGTYDYFTQAIVGTERSSRMDFQASEDDDELARGVIQDELALGFFGYAYLHKHEDRLKPLAVDNENPEDGQGPIAPSPETVSDGTYRPLSRPLFIYVSKSSLSRREVELFVTFYLSKCTNFVSRVGYVPLPEKAYRLAQHRVAARRTGSLFANGGLQVGISIEQLLAREQSVGKTQAAR